ncbi:MAG: penicillin-binding transpeptidase domain-containing protein [Eubacteriales bacterium]
MKNHTYNKRKIMVVFLVAVLLTFGLIGRLIFLMVVDAEYYQELADDLHEREREIKAARGEIIDINGVVLAANETVCTISVIHSQVEDVEEIVDVLSEMLDMDEDAIREIVEKNTSMEKIKSNVSKEIGDAIREANLSGIKVDEDYKRYYPYGDLASKVIGFTGSDNQGIIGLEVEYEEYLKGENGTILTTTDATGIELDGIAEERIEPIEGDTLQISLDYNIQSYIQQEAELLLEEKEAEAVQVIAMNPQTGEIYAMVNVPEFDLNNPFTLVVSEEENIEDITTEEEQELLNQMWRNGCISDTYEPGSTFKIITAAAALEEEVVSLASTFTCSGFCVVDGTSISCHQTTGHGNQTFIEAVQNSCNPVFVSIGLSLGASTFYSYFEQFGLLSLTNVDLPGEAATIMHNLEDINAIELATISFGQSFQVTPIQLATTISSIVNGGTRVTPHLGMNIIDSTGEIIETFEYEVEENIVSEETSELMQMILESVVSEGSGINAYIEGYEIGGKTATSQTLPRSENKYISSFVGFAPADDPEILIIALVYDPQGVYYGGTIVAPVVGDIFDNVLPYLGIEKGTEEIIEITE